MRTCPPDFEYRSTTPAPRRIIFGHGFHSNEPYVKEFYDYLTAQDKNPNVTHAIISPPEWRAQRRLVDAKENLANLIPDPNGTRAERILTNYCLRTHLYDLAIQPHGTRVRGGEAAMYGPNASPLVKRAARHLGLTRAILKMWGGPELALPHSLGVEIAPDSPLTDPSFVHSKVTELLELPELPDIPNPEEYAYMADITTKGARALKLNECYDSFSPLTSRDTHTLTQVLGTRGVQLVAYAWNAHDYDHTGFRGELLARLPLPSDAASLTLEHRAI